MNRDSTPTFNVNRKIANFKDFLANTEAEEEELKKIQRSNTPNSADQKQIIGNKKYKFNKTTRKIDDPSPDEIEDDINSIEELKEDKKYLPGGMMGIMMSDINPTGFNDAKGSNNSISAHLKNQIKVAFENTVMCARTNTAKESYDYAEKMANMIINLIEQEK